MTFIPIIVHHESPRCPSCDRRESLRTTCRHCGYEYGEDDDLTTGEVVLLFVAFLVVLVLFSWLVCTFVTWALPIGDKRPTLVEVLAGQWEWIKGFRIW